MALPQSGTITMGQVRTELKKSGSLNLGNQEVRKIAKVPNGTIKMSNLYGKSAELTYVKIKEVRNRITAPFNTAPMIKDVINPVLKEFGISFPEDNLFGDEAIGATAFSEDKIYKAVITNATIQQISNGLAHFTVTADVYKGK